MNEALKDTEVGNKKACRMIYVEWLFFKLVKSFYIKSAMEVIVNFDSGYTLYHETRVTYLQKEVED